MSKLIKATEETIAAARAKFEEAVKLMKSDNGKLTFTLDMGAVDRKATLYFTELAWLKMTGLVSDFSSEVGWHGVARRGDDPEKDEYIVSDIMVYPQEVTGATVTTDQTEYNQWLFSFDNDVFNHIRFQGHSHVNMGVTPSGTDLSLYSRILDMLGPRDFYIFLIINKSGQMTIKIYDMAKNILFETNDVEVRPFSKEIGLMDFIKQAKEIVKTKAYTTPTYSGNYSGSYSGNYSGGKYASDYYHTQTQDKKEEKPAVPAVTPLPATSSSDKRMGKRKGRRTQVQSKKVNNAADLVDDYDDLDYPPDDFSPT